MLLGITLLVSSCKSSHIEPTLQVQQTLPQPTAALLRITPTPEDESASLVTTDWAVQLAPDVDPNEFALEYNAANLGQVGALPNIYLFRRPCPILKEKGIDPLTNDLRVLWFEEQIPHQQSLRSIGQEDQGSIGNICSK